MKYSKIRRPLLPWQESDGEYIHLAALAHAWPWNRWDLYLIGTSSGASSKKPSKVQPLLGRTRQSDAVVVLLSSMHRWLTHYNPGKPEAVDAMINDLRKAERAYVKNLMEGRSVSRMKHAWVQSRPTKSPKPPAVKPMKVTSNDIFGVWK